MVVFKNINDIKIADLTVLKLGQGQKVYLTILSDTLIAEVNTHFCRDLKGLGLFMCLSDERNKGYCCQKLPKEISKVFTYYLLPIALYDNSDNLINNEFTGHVWKLSKSTLKMVQNEIENNPLNSVVLKLTCTDSKKQSFNMSVESKQTNVYSKQREVDLILNEFKKNCVEISGIRNLSEQNIKEILDKNGIK